jgi:hypothetical protein
MADERDVANHYEHLVDLYRKNPLTYTREMVYADMIQRFPENKEFIDSIIRMNALVAQFVDLFSGHTISEVVISMSSAFGELIKFAGEEHKQEMLTEFHLKTFAYLIKNQAQSPAMVSFDGVISDMPTKVM